MAATNTVTQEPAHIILVEPDAGNGGLFDCLSDRLDAQVLPAHSALDAIERAAIRDKRSPLETYLLMRVEFPEYSQDQLLCWVERFFVLWSRNQWKRERYAPSFHLDDANLDPKTWCRWPILSGGFERELELLRTEAAREGKP